MVVADSRVGVGTVNSAAAAMLSFPNHTQRNILTGERKKGLKLGLGSQHSSVSRMLID